jgi:hypothetical protein
MSVAAPVTRGVSGVPDCQVNVLLARQFPSSAAQTPPLFSHGRFSPNGSSTLMSPFSW